MVHDVDCGAWIVSCETLNYKTVALPAGAAGRGNPILNHKPVVTGNAYAAEFELEGADMISV